MEELKGSFRVYCRIRPIEVDTLEHVEQLLIKVIKTRSNETSQNYYAYRYTIKRFYNDLELKLT